VSWKSHSSLGFRPRECQPVTASLQARILLSCLAGPLPQSPVPLTCWRGPAGLGNDATASFVEQKPRWVLVAHGRAETLRCILRNSQYPWMSWYQQDLQGQLEVLATLRYSGDEEGRISSWSRLPDQTGE
uniref:Immunoglobulin V-set domain-containing protein n=1 Tax=Equus asinus TaxID=9793 RepID=A0A9L0I5F1_EQUAS